MLWSPRVDYTTSLFYSPSFEFMGEENGHTRNWRRTLSLVACHNLTAFVSHVMRGQKMEKVDNTSAFIIASTWQITRLDP